MTPGERVRIELPQPFEPGMVKLAFVAGRQILIVNAEGRLYGIDNSCPHAGGSLYGAKLVGTRLRCPSHGLLIDLASGCLADSSSPGARVYQLNEVPGGVELTL